MTYAKLPNAMKDPDLECAICLSEYMETDEITTLMCHERHFFHSACIKKWLDNLAECPLCRMPITNF